MKNNRFHSVKKIIASKWLLLFVGITIFTFNQVKAQAPCHAYGYAWVNGNAVQFFDSSYVTSGFISSNNSYVSWGDGSVSYSSNNWNSGAILSHNYSNNGTYRLCTHIFDSLCTCSDSFCQTIIIGNTCGINASFTYSIANNIVSFTNTSSGTYTGTTWNTQGGYKYFTTNAIDTFFAIGIHNVCMRIYGAGGCSDSICQSINITSLPSTDTISGYVFNDLNNNGVMDLGEAGFANETIYVSKAGSGSSSLQTDANGYYQTVVLSGNYNISLNFSQYTYTQTVPLTPNSFYNPTLGNNQNAKNQNFGFYQAPCPTVANATGTSTGSGSYNFGATITNNNLSVQYYWSFGDGSYSNSSNPSHTYLMNGTYSPQLIIYSNNYQCRDSFPLAAVTVTGLSNCSGQAQFNAYPNGCGANYYFYATNSVVGNTYLWNFGDGTNQTGNYYAYHNYASSGNYIVTLVSYNSSNNCYDTASQTININTSSMPIASFTYSIIGNTVNLTNTSTGAISSYWYFDDGISSSSANATHSFITGGSHWVSLSVYNSNGCSDSISQTIFIAIPNADTLSGSVFNDANNNAVKDAGEHGMSNQFIYAYVQGVYTYTYTDANGNYSFIVPIGTDSIFAQTPSGYTQTLPISPNYFYTNTGTGNQHISNLDFGFYQAPCPTIYSATATQISMGLFAFDDSILNKNSSIIYYWNYGDGTNWGMGDTSSHAYSMNGTYYPSLIIYSNNYQCTDTFALSPIIVSGLSVCSGQAQFNPYPNGCNGSYYFYATNFNNSNIYNWDFGDGTNLSGSYYTTHNYALSGNYVVTLVSYNSPNNCYDTSSQTINVNVTPAPSASFTYTTIGNTLNLTSTSTGSISSYYWYYDDGYYDVVANPSHTFLIGGSHWVSLSVTNSNGCSDSIYQTIFITIPNADTLSGVVFNDANNNGIRDVGEIGIPYQYVQLYTQGTSTYAYTDSLGFYSFIVPPGADSIYAPYIWMYSRTLPVSSDHYIVTTTGNHNLSGFDFGFVDTTSTITGHVYFDNNGNGIQDVGESDASSIRVDVFSNSMSTHLYTDYNGNYTALLYNGNSTFNITCNPVLSNYVNYNISTTPTQYNVTTVGASTYTGNDFGLHPISSTSGDNLMINIAPYSTIVPGYTGWYYITVKNIGSTTVSGNVVYTYDPALSYSYSTFGTNNGALHQLSWLVSNIAPGFTSQNIIYMQLASTTTLGTILNHSAVVSLTGSATDVDPSNNTCNYQQVVVGSFDPNIKSVSPVGSGSTGAINPSSNDELTYTIQFQNTGTAPAINIVVKDVIDPDMDLNSLQMLESSHNNSLTINTTTREAIWKFENIMLPDSSEDEPHSHGLIQYKIKMNTQLAQGTSINNTAGIYFDFNSPVITNTTVNTVDYTLAVNDLNEELPTISIAPNPMNEFATIKIEGLSNLGNIELTLTNVIGEKIKTLQNQSSIIRIERNQLSSGIYFYELKNNNKTIGKGKLVIE